MQRSASSLVAAIRSANLTAAGAVADALAAIAERDHALHAMLTLNPAAMGDAQACDKAVAGGATGRLQGVPLVVKDNIDVAGLPTTSGCRALVHAMPRRDAAQVARLKAEGAIVVGKTNLSEFSFEIRSRSSLGGDTVNVFRPDVTGGGSSGGTAVAVAAGFAVAGLGTDTGGSIRVPAAFNGLVGMRPTHGRLSLAGVAPLAPSTDTVGPITRCVADAALLLEVMAGTPMQVHPDGVRGRRVGVLRQASGDDPAILAALAQAQAALGAAGIVVIDPVALPDELLPTDGEHIVDVEFGRAFDAYLAENFVPGTAPASLREILASGAFLPELAPALRSRLSADAAAQPAILARHAALRNALFTLMRRHDLAALLHPTSIVMPQGFDNPRCGWGAELAAQSGWPAISVPSGSWSGGLPIGVDLLGPPATEPMLLALAAAIERGSGDASPPSPDLAGSARS